MVPELGYFSLLLALCFALIQGISPIALQNFNHTHKKSINELCRMASFAQFIFLLISMACLIISFIVNDMTVIYVRDHSHELLPLVYRMGAAWGGHEGSLLLWCLILSAWASTFTVFSYNNVNLKAGKLGGTFVQILMVLGWVSMGFITFLITTSNPFLRDFPTSPVSGNDLTPSLQDPGLIFHPPMLYLGYVGFTIGFAFAIAALLEGKLDKHWATACKPWIVLPWGFLGCGIVLGSWWAYRELGWGGWWFWDPVENASLMPWLVATALIHSLRVTEKCGAFKGWTLLLAIITFALSLIGTFLVRSGVLISVHAFANDPARGIFLLIYIAIMMSGALLLYAYRIKQFYQPPFFKLFSRETSLLINSIILLTATATILIGTLYPIILDSFNSDKISVGEPYFNTLFVPLMVILLLLMGLAPLITWQTQLFQPLWQKIWRTIILSLLIGLFLPQLCGFKFSSLASIGIGASIWVILATLKYLLEIWRNQRSLKFHYWAMVIAHIGIAIIGLGITFNKSYSEERQVRIKLGETITLAGYQFYFAKTTKEITTNYRSITNFFKVKSKYFHGELSADQRVYLSHQQVFSHPGVSYNAWRDLYLALGNVFPDGSWSVRIYYKPCVRWIWFGGFLILFSGVFSFFRQKNTLQQQPGFK